jgi:hypothetical protein
VQSPSEPQFFASKYLKLPNMIFAAEAKGSLVRAADRGGCPYAQAEKADVLGHTVQKILFQLDGSPGHYIDVGNHGVRTLASVPSPVCRRKNFGLLNDSCSYAMKIHYRLSITALPCFLDCARGILTKKEIEVLREFLNRFIDICPDADKKISRTYLEAYGETDQPHSRRDFT